MTVTVALLSTAAFAETFEIKMLNRGEDGAMVFEPSFVAAMPGDTISFLAVDRGHDVESIEGMLPDGVEPFKSSLSEPFSITLDQEGLYGIKCSPHYALGMVALIQVGAPVNLEAAQSVTHRGKAAQRFAADFAQVQQ
jgi:pseudoazurin